MSSELERLVSSKATLLGENGLLFRQIDAYVEDFICNEFLKNNEYPNWKEELVCEDIEDFINNIINQTINSEEHEYSNMEYFHIPPTYKNAHGIILKYISLCGRNMMGDEFIIDDKFIFDGDYACVSYAYWWLNNNRTWLEDRLKEFRLSCMEEDVSN